MNRRSPANYIALGVAIGAGLGVAFHNIAAGVGIGAGIGAAFSVILGRYRS